MTASSWCWQAALISRGSRSRADGRVQRYGVTVSTLLLISRSRASWTSSVNPCSWMATRRPVNPAVDHGVDHRGRGVQHAGLGVDQAGGPYGAVGLGSPREDPRLLQHGGQLRAQPGGVGDLEPAAHAVAGGDQHDLRPGQRSARRVSTINAPSCSFGAMVSAGACSTWAPRRSRAAIRSAARRSEVTPIRKPRSSSTGTPWAGVRGALVHGYDARASGVVNHGANASTTSADAVGQAGASATTSPITTTAGELTLQPAGRGRELGRGGDRAALGVGEAAFDHRGGRARREPGAARGRP